MTLFAGLTSPDGLKSGSNSRGVRPFVVPPGRGALGRIAEEAGFRIGVELGVHRGDFAEVILTTWKSVTHYYLVDVWKRQENYADLSNVSEDLQVCAVALKYAVEHCFDHCRVNEKRLSPVAG